MWDINQSFKDNNEMSGHVSIFLNADKPLNPYHISYPIAWTGYINNEPVKIVQTSSSSKFIENYNFEIYPYGYSLYQTKIVDAIDRLLRRALD
ncbi:hypothetical protein ACLI1A_08255 [Flavobacterium sp. RHBU_3]|uniref:hypothetical protein n=1 Tax=Flavobacterium sp. RHBU_3 TaxID=3391184 RepID=UPI003984F790